MDVCKECGNTTFQDEVDGPVCTACGTLLNPSFTRLVSVQEEIAESNQSWQGQPGHSRPLTLKSVRSDRWDLGGQSSQGRNERNMLSMNETLEAIARRLGWPGSAARAQHLFRLAFDRSKIRWGRMSTVAAGAALVLTIREDSFSDATQDVAFLLSLPSASLTSMLMRLLPIWGVHLPPAVATSAVPATLSHLVAFVSADNPDSQTVPSEVLAFLRNLVPSSTRAIQQIAEGIYDMLARPGGDPSVLRHPVLEFSVPTVAGALVLLALEGHARRCAPRSLDIANILGTRTGCSGKTIAIRYRVILDEIERGFAQVPWLQEGSIPQDHRKLHKGRNNKESRRNLLARHMLDIVQYCQSSWKARIENGGPIALSVEVNADDGNGDFELESQSPSSSFLDELVQQDVNVSSSSAANKGKKRQAEESLPTKKRKRKQISRAAHHRAEDFLLNPFIEKEFAGAPGNSKRRRSPPLDHTAHVLAPNTSLSSRPVDPPTRLQLLSTSRGGEEAIGDDELFDEGELEGLMASPKEVAEREPVLAELFGSKWSVPAQPKLTTTKEEKAARRGKGRLNAEALAKVMQDESWNVDELTRGFASDAGLRLLSAEDEEDDDYDDDDEDESGVRAGSVRGLDGIGDNVEILPWRAVSPGLGEYEERFEF